MRRLLIVTFAMSVLVMLPGRASADGVGPRTDPAPAFWGVNLHKLVGQVLTRLAALTTKDATAERAEPRRERAWSRHDDALQRVHRLFASLDLNPRHIIRSRVKLKRPGNRYHHGYTIADGLKSPTMIGYPGDHISAWTWDRLEVSTDGRMLVTTMIQPEDHPEGLTGQRVVSLEQARQAFPRADIRTGVKNAFTD